MATEMALERVERIVGEVGVNKIAFGEEVGEDTISVQEFMQGEASAFAGACFLALGSGIGPQRRLTLSQVSRELRDIQIRLNALVPRGRLEGETRNMGLGLAKRLWEASFGRRLKRGLGFADEGKLGLGGVIRVGVSG